MSRKLSRAETKIARERIEQKIMLSSVPVSIRLLEESLGLSRPTIAAALRSLSRNGCISEIGYDGNTLLWQWVGNTRQSQPGITPGRMVSVMVGQYIPAEWGHETARPGACDHEKYPSRMGDTLHYRDGRQEHTAFAQQFPLKTATAKQAKKK